MAVEVPDVVVPGQPIVPIVTSEAKFVPGEGTKISSFEINGSIVRSIVSCLLGRVSINEVVKEEPVDKDESKEKAQITYTVSVSSKSESKAGSNSSSGSNFSTKPPLESDIVLARVTKITPTRVYIEILNIDDANVANPEIRDAELMTNLLTTENGENFKGIIRSQDIRSTNRDTVDVGDCFRPGDIIRAEVISLGDGVNYYLTTARNDLGVVFAKSNFGNGPLMYALDWENMIVPSTGEIEKRKCAKPF